MVCLSKKFIELGYLVSVKFTVWENTNGCSEQYQCALVIYLMTMLRYFFNHHGSFNSFPWSWKYCSDWYICNIQALFEITN